MDIQHPQFNPLSLEDAAAFHACVRRVMLSSAPSQDLFEKAKARFESKEAYGFTFRIASALSPSLFKSRDLSALARHVRSFVSTFYDEIDQPLEKDKEPELVPYSTLAN